MSRSNWYRSVSLAIVVFCPVLLGQTLFAQTAQPGNTAQEVWTFEDAQAQLRLYPKDPFLQYVALKLAQRQHIDGTSLLNLHAPTRRQIAQQRREDIDLFNMFSGALAVQESLQLDAMRPVSDFDADRKDVSASSETLVSSLIGPTVISHPWSDMLAGRKPPYSQLANYIPADNYYIRFRSVTRMLDVIDGGDLFAGHLYSQTGSQAFVRDTERRLRQQLAVETNPLARPFYDLVVKELAMTGSDPFVNEGSDVTLLFRYEQDAVFRTQMDQYLTAAAAAVPGVTRTEETWEGTPIIHVASPHREVHVFSAYPKPGLHVRSNSRHAIRRVLSLISNRLTEDLISLGSTHEFQYIRTLMPLDAPEEDGLIYLSDPFIRRLVGPELKLTELRRLTCFNHLRMIGFAAALFESENGRVAASIDELQAAKCLPDGFLLGRLKCSCGGQYSLSADGRHGVCSHHGHADNLIPCCEIAQTHVTEAEAEAYGQFVTEYSQYWRTFFDPIAIKVQANEDRYRLETIVLPLINNTIYQSLAMALGGEPQQITRCLTDDTVMSLSFAVAKERLLEQSGWQPPEEATEGQQTTDATVRTQMQASRNNLLMIGLAMHNYHDVHGSFPPAFTKDAAGRPLLSWRVHVLPYLDEAELYEQFHLNEPWDSPHNKTLIGRMPNVFRSPGSKPEQIGATTYLTVNGPNTLFPGDGKAMRLHDTLDGTLNTGLVVDASNANQTIWTQPNDLKLEAAQVRKSLTDRFGNGGQVLFADGSVNELKADLPNSTIDDLFNRNDGNVTGDISVEETGRRRSRSFLGLDHILGGYMSERDVYVLLKEGLGNSIGLHVCDNDPTFDLQLTEILAEVVGDWGGGGRGSVSTEALGIGMAVASLTSPVYITLDVNDAEVVDAFLSKLDAGVAIEARTQQDLGWFELDKDFYTIPLGRTSARSFVVSLGPVKWRFFYCRIGDVVCIASKIQTLQQLVAKQETEAVPNDAAVTESATPTAHAAIAIHRKNWDRMIPTLRLTWDEAARNACLDNIGPLTSASHVAAASSQDADHSATTVEHVSATARSIYGGIHYCPCGGHYMRNEDGHMVCSVHGNADHPRQPAPGAENGASKEVLDSFSEIRVMLTFLEDGLHAVLEVDRRRH